MAWCVLKMVSALAIFLWFRPSILFFYFISFPFHFNLPLFHWWMWFNWMWKLKNRPFFHHRLLIHIYQRFWGKELFYGHHRRREEKTFSINFSLSFLLFYIAWCSIGVPTWCDVCVNFWEICKKGYCLGWKCQSIGFYW